MLLAAGITLLAIVSLLSYVAVIAFLGEKHYGLLAIFGGGVAVLVILALVERRAAAPGLIMILLATGIFLLMIGTCSQMTVQFH